MASIDEELQILENKVKQLKLDFEQYFLGTRPREPIQLRAEVQKQILIHSNTPIKNTAARFRFNSINSRFQAFKRQWDTTLRQIEAGTYKRHIFKANLHERERGIGVESGAAKPQAPQQNKDELFETYRDAAMACGQSVKGLTREKLQSVIDRQGTALRKKLGCDDVNFRVVVEGGKVKLKASAGS
jgi:hypothetical protein